MLPYLAVSLLKTLVAFSGAGPCEPGHCAASQGLFSLRSVPRRAWSADGVNELGVPLLSKGTGVGRDPTGSQVTAVSVKLFNVHDLGFDAFG